MTTKKIIFAVDVMGTDKGPSSVIEGVHYAAQTHPEIKFLLFGPLKTLQEILASYSNLSSCCELIDCPEFISNEDKVAQAIRRKNTSMRKALEAVAAGEADAIISGGNTGAYMALAKILLKTIPGISRPAIATSFPTAKGKCILLDMGANIECSPAQLVEFAIMGNTFAKDLFNLPQPRVGLLNIGSEELKGKPELHETHQMLKKIPHVLTYEGFMEGNNISQGEYDVVVTDGFTGNVAIKTAEGIGGMIAGLYHATVQNSLLFKVYRLFSSGSFRKVLQHFDPVKYNGAMFLGLNKLAIKSHGGASAKGFANAIEVAYKLNQYEFNHQIERDIVASQSVLA